MDGNQPTQTTANNNSNKFGPVNNPPSLVEPSQSAASQIAVSIPHAPASVAQQPAPVQTPMPEPVSLQLPSQTAALPLPAPTPTPAQAPVATDVNSDLAPVQEEGFYHAGTGAVASYDEPVFEASGQSEQPVSWVSSGDAIQAHTSAWRVKMTLTSVIIGAAIYLLTRDVVSSGSVAVAGILFGFLGARKPLPLQYEVGPDGVTVGQRHYVFIEFRAFSVNAERTSVNIDLVPLKRFAPILSIHADAAISEQVVTLLSNHLPMEAHRRDAFDAIISKAKF